MKRIIALALMAVLLLGSLAACNSSEELDLTPDDKMTIAICALARSAQAQKDTAKPTCYSVKGVRTLDGVKTMETTSSYDAEKLFTVTESRYYEGETFISSEINYVYVASVLGTQNDGFQIISATEISNGETTKKEYKILYTAKTTQEVETFWNENKLGADMSYQTYGRLEDLIVAAAMSQGGAEAEVSSADDFKLTIATNYKTERYTIVDNYITQLVWTEMTANGEDENTWNYYWNITDVTLPNLADFILVVE